MASIHISVAEAARDFAGLLAKARAGAEIVIEDGTQPVAVMHTPVQPDRAAAECIALLPDDSSGVLDEDFPSRGSPRIARSAILGLSVGLILDSSVLIAAERRNQRARQSSHRDRIARQG